MVHKTKLRTQYGNVLSTLKALDDNGAEGIGVAVGSTSNGIVRTLSARFRKDELGKQHIITRLGLEV